MGELLIICIWGIIWGFVCCKIIENKGYDDSGMWFLWGFLFSFVAAIVALSKPENHKTVQNTSSSYEGRASLFASKPLNAQIAAGAGEWKCLHCGKINNNYVGTCSCGWTKDETKAIAERAAASKIDAVAQPKPVDSTQNFEAIKKLKELLDMGAITQEEFDKKKNELLK